MTFRERLKSSTLPCSSMMDKANALMTKTGVTVTVIFVLSMGYGIIYHILGEIGAVVFVLHSPLQKLGLLLSAFNSVANPFVYVLLMPAFRRSLRKTFHLPTLRCDVCRMSDAIEVSCARSGSATRGTDLAIGDIDDRVTSPDNVQLEIHPVTYTV